MNSATGEQIQQHLFGRMPRFGDGFVHETGERVTAQCVDIGKPAPGRFVTPVDIWVLPRT